MGRRCVKMMLMRGQPGNSYETAQNGSGAILLSRLMYEHVGKNGIYRRCV
jgi:hypothetical protein